MNLAYLLVLISTLGGCSSQDRDGVVHGQTTSSAAIRYLNGDRTSAVTFDRGELTMGMTEEARRNLTDADGLRGDFTWDAPIQSCSDAEFECLKADPYVFAVPRGQLQSGYTFEREGIRFTVERCNDAPCRSAIVRADCESFGAGRQCSTNSQGRAASATPGEVTYFVYQRDRGVVSFGSSADDAGASSRSGDYVLTGRRGILAPR